MRRGFSEEPPTSILGFKRLPVLTGKVKRTFIAPPKQHNFSLSPLDENDSFDGQTSIATSRSLSVSRSNENGGSSSASTAHTASKSVCSNHFHVNRLQTAKATMRNSDLESLYEVLMSKSLEVASSSSSGSLCGTIRPQSTSKFNRFNFNGSSGHSTPVSKSKSRSMNLADKFIEDLDESSKVIKIILRRPTLQYFFYAFSFALYTALNRTSPHFVPLCIPLRIAWHSAFRFE
jgi:hypothetical protein